MRGPSRTRISENEEIDPSIAQFLYICPRSDVRSAQAGVVHDSVAAVICQELTLNASSGLVRITEQK